ncbi:MAG: PEGA domain-containing protein [Treponema sp.]|nr:PEGA domain-containing protein [Treponema sp.]
MIKTRFILLLFIFLFPVILWANDPETSFSRDRFEEIEGRGLVIQTNPRGARVFINGIDRGITPVTLENLQSGEYNIRLTRDGFKERNFNVTLFDTSRLTAFIEMEEAREIVTITVLKDPFSPEQLPFKPEISAGVLSNDNTANINMPLGNHTIRARAFGWEDTSVSVLVSENSTPSVEIYMKRAAFTIENVSQSRHRFNPKNSGDLGVTRIRFEVSAPGDGNFVVLDSYGSVVYERKLQRFNERVQHVIWDGKDLNGFNLPQGLYSILIEANAIAEYTTEVIEIVLIKMETEINYSMDIFSLSLDSGTAGLTFSPLPNTLPAGSYQFDAGILFAANGFSLPTAFPFKIGARFAPIDKLELTSVFNINPLENPGWGISASLKYNFFNGSNSNHENQNLPVSIAAGISYAWANENGESFLSSGRGISLFAPISLELPPFLYILCPVLFLPIPDSFIPRAALCAGFLYKSNWINTGLSFKSEFDLENDIKIKFMIGADARFYPGLSNLFIYLQAGMLTSKMFTSNNSFYGGLGIGMIF